LFPYRIPTRRHGELRECSGRAREALGGIHRSETSKKGV
jgi:hypothetical protein